MTDPPQTRYAKADDGVHIAYQVFGDGPIDLVVIPGFISHLDLVWEDPGLAGALERLGSFARVIAFDKRGTGMSDRAERLPDMDRRMLDIGAVMDAVGCRQAALFGVSEGGPMAIVFAATHPERVQALILLNTFGCLAARADFTIGVPRENLDHFVEHIEPRWGTGVGLGAWAPSIADDPASRTLFARLQRVAASPGSAMVVLSSLVDVDVRAALPLIHAPTLVMHRSGDRMIPLVLGRHLAEHIPGARFLELDGTDHFWWTEDTDRILDETQEFLTGTRPAVEPDRVLATVLFTDIVDSTHQAVARGDKVWRVLLDQHDSLADRQVTRFGGRIVKTTGDGVLATFDGPARAVRCAQAISEGARSLGLEVRAGVHTGEVERRGDDIAGLGVHIASRIESLAGPGEVLVSRTVTDLVAGSGIAFRDRGPHDLKGVPGRWEVFLATP
jgi:class 3 adenylate cyclase